MTDRLEKRFAATDQRFAELFDALERLDGILRKIARADEQRALLGGVVPTGKPNGSMRKVRDVPGA